MRYFMIVGIILATLVFIEGCTPQQESTQGTYIDVSPAEAKALIDENPDLIIIAVDFYAGDGVLDVAIPTLDKSKPYLVYCDVSPNYDQGHLPGRVDSASIQGAQKLVEAGFPRVYRLEGNYKDWVDAVYPIEK